MRLFSRFLPAWLIASFVAVSAPLPADSAESGNGGLPRDVILTVKSASLKELSDKVVGIARQVAPGPQVESLPFMLGALLGDPQLGGVEPGENVGFALVKVEQDYLPVVFARLTEESPYRQSLPGYGMTVADYEGWTFATAAPLEPEALAGKRDELLNWVRSPREHDLEVRINGPEVARFILGRETEIRRPLRELNAAEYEEAVWAVVQTLAGEFKIMSSIGYDLDLGSETITQHAHLDAEADSALGRFLSADHAASTAVAEWIAADRPVVFLGRTNPDALLEYLRYFSAKAGVSGGEPLRAVFESLENMTRLYAEHSEGNNAGYFGFSGLVPSMVQISDSSFEDETLREWLHDLRDLMEQPPLDGFANVESATELEEGERTIGGVPVPVYTLRTRIDADAPQGDGAEASPGAYYGAMDDQVVHYARAGDYLVMAYSGEELENLVGAVLANEPPADSAAGHFDRESGLAGQIRIDGGALLSVAAGFMAPGHEMDSDLPPATGRVRIGDNAARGRFDLPVELVAGAYREIQAMSERMEGQAFPPAEDGDEDSPENEDGGNPGDAPAE